MSLILDSIIYMFTSEKDCWIDETEARSDNFIEVANCWQWISNYYKLVTVSCLFNLTDHDIFFIILKIKFSLAPCPHLYEHERYLVTVVWEFVFVCSFEWEWSYISLGM